MTASLDGRILVTGASRRVGRAVAIELARRGLDLVLCHRSSPDDCEQTAALCREVAPRRIEADVVELHLESDEHVRSVASELAARELDGIVHNASRYVRTPLDTLDSEEVMEHFRINALAPLVLSALLAGNLRRSRLPRGGAIVCLGDMHSMGRPRRHHAGYLASKGALDRIVEALALELGPEIRVNGVAPGVVAWAEDDLGPEEQRRYVERIPLLREGSLEEAAETVAWLLLDAGYVNGTMLPLDGGRHLG
ncbi:MAG: SDR family oxidoreductase [Phycisphaerales bacterium]|nr:SDR family oxidoreductase [Phycisphaerales bacterium]